MDETMADGVAKVSLEVDWEALAVAVENQLPTSRSFLDRDCGRVLTLRAVEGVVPDAPAEEGDWLLVPPRSSRAGYGTMQRFVEQVEDGAFREKLTAALVGRGAFRRFKDLLIGDSQQRQAWFAFKDAEVYAYISDWLAEQGVAATNPPPAETSRSRMSAAVRRSAAPPVFGPADDSAAPWPLTEAELDWRAVVASYDRPDRIFRPDRTALLVIDMQRIFVDPDGSSFLPLAVEAGRRLAGLIASFRRSGRPVIFTRHIHRLAEQDGGAMARWWRSLIMEGSWGSELAEAFRPREGERLISKCRYDAFASTELEMVLRSLRVEDLLIGGVMTNLCCETTAREAFVRDFNVFFLADGTAAPSPNLHLASLCNIAYGFGRVLSVDEAVRTVDTSTGQSEAGAPPMNGSS